MVDPREDLPAWADRELSEQLPHLREKGEGQSLEFKERIPSQASDLAKEVAAFSTSNDGMVLLGICESGELRGLDEVDTPEGRDLLKQRLAGVCRDRVKPPVHPAVRWAVEHGKTVAVLEVHKGDQPVYYCDHRPYVRRESVSRPAQPDEVQELVLAAPRLSHAKKLFHDAAKAGFAIVRAERPSRHEVESYVEDVKCLVAGVLADSRLKDHIWNMLLDPETCRDVRERLPHLASYLANCARRLEDLGASEDRDQGFYVKETFDPRQWPSLER